MDRRRFLHFLSLLGLAPALPSCSSIPRILYPAAPFGQVSLLHITDCHAQLLPVYYREPFVHPGADGVNSQARQLAGAEFLRFFGIRPHSREAYAFTHFDFSEAAQVYGKMGGFAYLAALIQQIKQESKHGNFLLLDGGDSWQGSGTALWTKGQDMVAACNQLGVEVMTGHWEFTYGSEQMLANLKTFKGVLVAQNISLTDEAVFAQDAGSSQIFPSYVLKEFGNHRIAVIGQAYPYTPIANPSRFLPGWQFGIQQARLQQTIQEIKNKHEADAVVLLSHNGLDIDLKLAANVTGLDVILGGHTHDALPRPLLVNNPGGRTWVTNAGSHGKFLAVLDLELDNKRLKNLRYRLLPVFANLLEPQPEMQALIDAIRQPYLEKLQQPLAIADQLLYRRDTYKGTFDDILLNALLQEHEAEIALSPGFRWGTAVLPGQQISYEVVLNHTAITYPNTLRRSISGAEIKAILEDAADNLFNPDPYYRQGGDMVRVGGMAFRCNPLAEMGSRVSEMRLTDGGLLEASKLYSVASWASVKQVAEGRPMADIAADYLSHRL